MMFKNLFQISNFKFQIIRNVYHFLSSLFWVIWYGYPARKLVVIGITGTDGKTTTSHLIYEILKSAGFKVALVSTVAAFIGDEEIDTGFHVTTAEARVLQPLLAKIVDRGFTHVVLEVTSHSLDQHRVVGCNFYTGVITNITHEHLDYHGTMERYRAAKFKLLRNVKYAVINDQISNPKSQSEAPWERNSNTQIIKYSKTNIKNISPVLAGIYNKENIAAAEATAKLLGVRSQEIEKAVKNFPGVPGRMEEIPNKLGFRIIVDFAHTPNALKQILSVLRAQCSGKLILVFGCAGLRDHTKRPMMGEIATRYADKVIVTAEDPRTEKLDDIYKQITSPLPSPEFRRGGSARAEGEVFRVDDRQEAINKAINMAKKSDIVVITGKGHEKSMCFGKTEYPWSDREAVLRVINAKMIK